MRQVKIGLTLGAVAVKGRERTGVTNAVKKAAARVDVLAGRFDLPRRPDARIAIGAGDIIALQTRLRDADIAVAVTLVGSHV